MRDGKMVEDAPASTIFAAPKADYTKALIAAAPSMSGVRKLVPA